MSRERACVCVKAAQALGAAGKTATGVRRHFPIMPVVPCKARYVLDEDRFIVTLNYPLEKWERDRRWQPRYLVRCSLMLRKCARNLFDNFPHIYNPYRFAVCSTGYSWAQFLRCVWIMSANRREREKEKEWDRLCRTYLLFCLSGTDESKQWQNGAHRNIRIYKS